MSVIVTTTRGFKLRDETVDGERHDHALQGSEGEISINKASIRHLREHTKKNQVSTKNSVTDVFVRWTYLGRENKGEEGVKETLSSGSVVLVLPYSTLTLLIIILTCLF